MKKDNHYLTIILIMMTGVSFLVLSCDTEKRCLVNEIKIDTTNITIEIWSEKISDQNKTFYFQIKENENIILPFTWLALSNVSGNHGIKTIHNKDKSIIGLYKELEFSHSIYQIMFLLNLDNGEKWMLNPFSTMKEKEKSQIIGEKLLNKLMKDHNGSKIVLKKAYSIDEIMFLFDISCD